MSVKLPEGKHPYSGPTPFEVLGVSTAAGKRDVKEAYEEKLEEIDDDHQGEDRFRERDRIKRAYEELREAKSRISVEIFFFDPTIGQQECRDLAGQHNSLKLDAGKVFQGAEDFFPTRPDVSHAKTQGRKVKFDRSTQWRLAEHPFEIDPTEQALASITFDS